MKNIDGKYVRTMAFAFLFAVVFAVWQTQGQGRRPVPIVAQPKWEYTYDVGSKSFATAADKTKIDLYSDQGWELTAVVNEQYQCVLVFRRPRQEGQ